MAAANIVNLIEEACQANKTKLAMIDNAGNQLSFERIFYAIQSLSQTLTDRGVARGDFVSSTFQEPAMAVVLYLALMKIGANPVLGWGAPEALARHSPIKYTIVPPDSKESGARILRFDRSWLAPAMGYVTTRTPGVIVCSSSGTTGEPKLQSVDHNVLKARIDQDFLNRPRPSGGVLIGYSFRAFYGLHLHLSMLIEGIAQVSTAGKSTSVVADCAAAGVSQAYLTPPLLPALLTAFEQADGAYGSWSLEEIYVGGSATSYQLARQAEETFGCKVFTGYGTSETGGIATCRMEPSVGEGHKVGPVTTAHKLKFVGENGAKNTPEIGGELLIWVPPPLRKSNYLNAEGPYFDDGWVKTGDLARMDGDGNLYITGRVHDLINFGGTKRSSEAFETVMARSGDVAAVAAVGAPNDGGYDDVCLFVVVKDGGQKADIVMHVKEKIAPMSRGTTVRVFWRDSLPMVENGKYDKKQIRQLARVSVPDEILVTI